MIKDSDPYDFFEKFEKDGSVPIPDEKLKDLILTLLHPEPDMSSSLSDILNRDFLKDHHS